MHTSFIVFQVLVLLVIFIAILRMRAKIRALSKRNDPDAQNNIPYDECLAKNAKRFQYGSFTDARDGETYRTVKIGNQVWMAENLRFKAEDSFAPADDEANVKQYGRLYTWTSALNIPSEFSEQSPAKDLAMYNSMKDPNYAGVSPEGWHIPSNKEWETLLENLAPKSNGKELRSACIWHEPGEDSLGFFALPAGYRFGNGSFCRFGTRARFWSKDEYGKCNAFRLSLTDESVDIEGVYRSDAISVRCVKNA